MDGGARKREEIIGHAMLAEATTRDSMEIRRRRSADARESRHVLKWLVAARRVAIGESERRRTGRKRCE